MVESSGRDGSLEECLPDAKGPFGKAHYLEAMRQKGCDMASVMRAVNWKPDPSDFRSGLLLHGPSGTGKTRAAYIRLWDFFAENKRLRVYSAAAKNGDFAHQVAARFSADQLAAKTWIESVKRAPVLFFDDAGKWVQTQRVEAEFFSVIEARFAMQLPTIITLNAGALNSARADAQCVDAIKRRLMDYSEVVKFELTKPAVKG